jgi:glycine cleavage system H protein
VQKYDIPPEIKYTKDHEWIRASSSSSYLVGITDYAAKMLNDIVYVTLPKEGTLLKKNQVFGQVESVKTVSDMYMPVSGRTTKTNSKLSETPELVSNSPYGDGWMMEISSDTFASESVDLLDADAYRKFVMTLDETA